MDINRRVLKMTSIFCVILVLFALTGCGRQTQAAEGDLSKKETNMFDIPCPLEEVAERFPTNDIGYPDNVVLVNGQTSSFEDVNLQVPFDINKEFVEPVRHLSLETEARENGTVVIAIPCHPHFGKWYYFEETVPSNNMMLYSYHVKSLKKTDEQYFGGCFCVQIFQFCGTPPYTVQLKYLRSNVTENIIPDDQREKAVLEIHVK